MKAVICKLDTAEVDPIDEAVRRIVAGELIVLPTETVYAAAARLDVESARIALAELRSGTPLTAPLVPHVDGFRSAELYVDQLNADDRHMMRRLTDRLWPGPVALDLPVASESKLASSFGIALSVISDAGRVTLRCPDHSATLEIIGRCRVPIAMVRVETSGGPSPWNKSAIESLPGGITWVLDAGPTRFNRPSSVVRLESGGYRVTRVGVFDQRIIEKQMQTTVLFVCSGNTCRSPMAAALARNVIAQTLRTIPSQIESKGYSVQSAGTFAMPGMKATPQAVEAVADFGADLAHHRSKTLSHELINAADLIVVMGQSHRMNVLAMNPAAASRTLLLDPEGDVEDPIGGDVSLYRELAGRFNDLIRDRLNQTIFKDR